MVSLYKSNQVDGIPNIILDTSADDSFATYCLPLLSPNLPCTKQETYHGFYYPELTAINEGDIDLIYHSTLALVCVYTNQMTEVTKAYLKSAVYLCSWVGHKQVAHVLDLLTNPITYQYRMRQYTNDTHLPSFILDAYNHLKTYAFESPTCSSLKAVLMRLQQHKELGKSLKSPWSLTTPISVSSDTYMNITNDIYPNIILQSSIVKYFLCRIQLLHTTNIALFILDITHLQDILPCIPQEINTVALASITDVFLETALKSKIKLYNTK